MPKAALRADAQAMSIDRRLALGSLAAGALLLAPRIVKGAPRSAVEGDPALAAIERHKTAAARLEAFLNAVLDEEDEKTFLALDQAERNAMFELADTKPTTHKGSHAALCYLVKEAGDRHYRVLGIFSASLIAAKWEA